MFKSLFYSIRAAWPIPAGIAVFLIAMLVRQIGPEGLTINLLIISTKLTSFETIRIVLVLIALYFFLLPALRDYSKIFPTDLESRLRYDEEGLRDALGELPARCKTELRAKTAGWEKERDDILESWSVELDRLIRQAYSDADKLTVPPFRFDKQTESVGEVKFRVKNVGFQAYEMIAGSGVLDHTYDAPQGRLIEARTYFKLAPGQKQIKIALADIYFRWQKVIVPVFKQYWESPDDPSSVKVAPILKPCVSVTNLTFFPSLKIGKTIFFVEAADGGGALIPVVYGQHAERSNGKDA